MLLFSSEVDFFATVARLDLEAKLASPDQMLHVLILSGSDKRPHQVLFLGDRILNIADIRTSLGLHDLNVDARFHDTNFEGGYLRISPMKDSQGCVTYVDQSLLEKEVVNVASPLSAGGLWINTADLVKMFKEVKTVSVSNYRAVDGMNMGDSLEFNDRASQSLVLREYIKSQGIKRYIFQSSKNEIITLRACGVDCVDADEIVDLLKTDCFLYAYVYEYYLSQGHSSAYSIDEIVSSIGKHQIMEFLFELVNHESAVDTRKIDFKLGRQIYNFQFSVSFIMEHVVKSKTGIWKDSDVQLATHLGHMSMLPMLSWMNMLAFDSFTAYSEKCSINSHRFFTEIQESIVGFNQFDALSFTCFEKRLPAQVTDILQNSNSPFYLGENSDLANLMYVVMATLVKKKLASNHLFEPIGNTELVLTKRLGIERELDSALKALSKIQDSIVRKEWRFYDNAQSKRPVLKIPAAHYMYVN